MEKLIWTETALDDLKLMHEYISKDSKLYADRFLDKIIVRVDQLENLGSSGRIVPEFNTSNIRELIEGNYRIIYKTSPSQVVILRIHHSARRLKTIL